MCVSDDFDRGLNNWSSSWELDLTRLDPVILRLPKPFFTRDYGYGGFVSDQLLITDHRLDEDVGSKCPDVFLRCFLCFSGGICFFFEHTLERDKLRFPYVDFRHSVNHESLISMTFLNCPAIIAIC
jgi:hypothetical protein